MIVMKKNKFYISTPIYYANAKPHIGHAYTTVAADVLTRFYKLQDKGVFFLTGMDEHGFKIQQAAEKAGKNPQIFVDEIAEEFKKLWKDLNIKYSGFIRTTDKKHKAVAQKVLQTLYNKDAIYKGEYEGLYCVGCEQFKSENELVDGKCPDHNTIPGKMKEECYLLKMIDKQFELIEKIKSDKFKIVPEKYKNEVLAFLESQKLKDISISRKNVKWGISLPFDSEHTTYVWVDAFLNYLTGLDWDGNINNIPEQWPVDVQLIGKDILRVHATIWPIILMYLGIELPKMIFTHGHILSGGKKMSKTLGNIINPNEMIEKFGVDGARYLLLSAGPFGEDIDMTMERMIEKYNADLANGLGNLVSRVIKLSSDIFLEGRDEALPHLYGDDGDMENLINKFEFDQALSYIWKIIADDNKHIAENKPWELVKTDEVKFKEVMRKLLNDLNLISKLLAPFMPETSEKIKKALEEKKLEKVLFQRIK
ncbi:TPA: methionine--tRNA ligase [Candidatus Moranbacteria bacterium]|nr:methionine--tRNA ligase [Candidatus Moranbacteria bacterium]